MYGFRILILPSRGVRFYWYSFRWVTAFHSSVIVHSFQKTISDLGKIFTFCVRNSSIDSACVYTAIHKC